MSSNGDEPQRGGAWDNTERIADPDDYNTRRRLKQLHDAKERVKNLKNDALDQQANEPRQFDKELEGIARRNVAEQVADYVTELRPILQQLEQEDEFLDETVTAIDGSMISLRLFRRREWFADNGEAPSIRTSMRAWDRCNDYLESVAGAIFDDSGPRTDIGDDLMNEVQKWRKENL